MTKHLLAAMLVRFALFSSFAQRSGICFFARALNLAAASFAAALMTGAASAGPILPAPVYSADVCFRATEVTGAAPGVYRVEDNAIVFISAVPFPAVGATAVGPGIIDQFCNSWEAFAGGGIEYSYEVTGPVVGTAVPMFVRYTITGSSVNPPGGTNVATAVIRGLDGGLGGLFDHVCFTSFGEMNCTDGARPLNPFPFTAITGTVYGVDIGVIAFVNANLLGGSASATVDPIIYIDPAFLAENPGYSVVVSDGIGNSAPEPATLALLGIGLAGLGFSRRRKLN